MNKLPGLQYQYTNVLAGLIISGGKCLKMGQEHQVPMVAEFAGYCVAMYPNESQFRLHPLFLDLAGYPHLDDRYYLGALVDVFGNGGIVQAIDSYNQLEMSINLPDHDPRLITNIKSL